jgi:hypothetical protein
MGFHLQGRYQRIPGRIWTNEDCDYFTFKKTELVRKTEQRPYFFCKLSFPFENFPTLIHRYDFEVNSCFKWALEHRTICTKCMF